MANFSTTTEANIQRANDIAAGDAVGWADAVGGAIKGVRDELGDASLLSATSGTGKLIRADDDDKLPVANLPDQIPTDNLPTGTTAGSIPLIGANGQLPASLLGGATLPGLTTRPTTTDINIITATGDTTLTIRDGDNLQALYVVAVGAGGYTNVVNSSSSYYFGFKGEVAAGLLPRFALEGVINNSDEITISVGAAASTAPGNTEGEPFYILPAAPSGIKNLFLARGGHTAQLSNRPSLSDTTDTYTTERRTGATIPSVSSPNFRNANISYSGAGGRTHTVQYTGWGAPLISGVCVVYEIY